MKLIPLPAFADNYIWMLHDTGQALVVDPGDAQPVLDALQQRGVQLQAILVTRHHPDHTGGVAALRQPTLPSTILMERQINPFLRTRQAAIIQAAHGFDASAGDEASIFAALRQ
jgi:glyoxylase-like metal-dependent hydrolase (beta-lactamase superfamily II)